MKFFPTVLVVVGCNPMSYLFFGCTGAKTKDDMQTGEEKEFPEPGAVAPDFRLACQGFSEPHVL